MQTATQTERLTVLTSPDEKRWITQKAASLGVSTSELTRRAWRKLKENNEDELTPEQEVELALLAQALNEAAPRIQASLDRTSATLQA